jgi:hypothetical protein
MQRAAFLRYERRRPSGLGRSEPDIEGGVLGEKGLMDSIGTGSRYYLRKCSPVVVGSTTELLSGRGGVYNFNMGIDEI